MPRRICGALVIPMLANSTISSRLPRFREFIDSRTAIDNETDLPTFHFLPAGIQGNSALLAMVLGCVPRAGASA